MADLKYEYGNCLPRNYQMNVISGRDSPQLRSDSSSPSTVISPNRCSWGSDGEKATSSSDGEKTSSPDEHFSSHESSCEQALGASVRSDDVDGGLLCNSMEYLGLGSRDLYPESGRARWPTISPESRGEGSLNTYADQHSVCQNDNVSITPELLRTSHQLHVSSNSFSDLSAIANDNHIDSVSNDTTAQRLPLVPNLFTSIVGLSSEQIVNQTAPKLETKLPIQVPLFPSLPKPGASLVPYLHNAHQQITYQCAKNVPNVPESNKITQMVYPQLFQRAIPPPIKEPEINYSIQVPNYFNRADTIRSSDSGFQEFALGNRAHSRVLNKNANPESESNFDHRAPIAPEVRPPNVPPFQSNLDAPRIGHTPASNSSHFKVKVNYSLPDVSLPPPRYDKPDTDFARPKNPPPKRAVVGRPVVGRPPVSLPCDPTAASCSDKSLSETVAYTQLWVSWDSLYDINQYNDAFKLIDQFNDCVKVYEESSAHEDMGSYVRRVVNVKEDREASKLPEHERQERLKGAIRKLNDEQAFLTDFLETEGNNAVRTLLPSKKQKVLSSATSDHLCTFCRQNGETEEFYSSHDLKDVKGKIICPTLRAFVCPFCGATGASAHTASYCPNNPNSVRVKHSPHKKNRDGFTRYSHGLKYTG